MLLVYLFPVVDRVLAKLPILMNKHRIDIERYAHPTVDDTQFEDETDSQAPQSLCTVEVRGMKPTTSDDAIEMYFETKRACGYRANVDKFDSSEREDQGVIYITFENEAGVLMNVFCTANYQFKYNNEYMIDIHSFVFWHFEI